MPRLPNISIEVKAVEYGVFDCEYFPSGQTPKFLWLTVMGILPGEKYPTVVDKVQVPQGTWKLTQVSSSIWEYVTDAFDITFGYADGSFIVIFRCVFEGLYYYAFIQAVDDWPYFSYANGYQVPENHYFYGGFCQVSWLPAVGVASVGLVAESVGIERNIKTFYQGLVDSDVDAVYRFARRSDHTCVKIRVGKFL